jgi:hypothetical protein
MVEAQVDPEMRGSQTANGGYYTIKDEDGISSRLSFRTESELASFGTQLVAAQSVSVPPSQIQPLLWIDLACGQAGDVLVPGKNVTIRYAAWLQDKKGGQGRLLDSNTDASIKGMGFVAGTGMVLAGVDEGIIGMRKGGRRRLIVPSRLAYGNLGSPESGIPPFATVIFEVLVESIEDMTPNLLYTIASNPSSCQSSFRSLPGMRSPTRQSSGLRSPTRNAMDTKAFQDSVTQAMARKNMRPSSPRRGWSDVMKLVSEDKAEEEWKSGESEDMTPSLVAMQSESSLAEFGSASSPTMTDE